MSNQNEIKCEAPERGEWCCITCRKYFPENKCYFENSKVYCMSCIPEDSEDEDEDEDEDDVCYRLNRGLECSVCYEKIIGKREYTGGQYADNDEPLCKVCWELPQHNCFHSCYKNANGKWWCEDNEDDSEDDNKIEDQDDFTNRCCGWSDCNKDFDLADPHYYDEESSDCYCSEECFIKYKKEHPYLFE